MLEKAVNPNDEHNLGGFAMRCKTTSEANAQHDWTRAATRYERGNDGHGSLMRSPVQVAPYVAHSGQVRMGLPRFYLVYEA